MNILYMIMTLIFRILYTMNILFTMNIMTLKLCSAFYMCVLINQNICKIFSQIPRTVVDDGTVDRREERARSVGESLTDGAAKAVETGLDVGEKAKESIDEAWDAAKETTNNIKDAMVDDANDEMKKGI